jgi:CDP-paratose 2-epimerase
MKTILVTGGAGFVGSHVALRLKQDEGASRVVAFDNLKRRGSELNLARLRGAGVEFLHGDVRIPTDLAVAGPIDVIVECSAEPSVLAGHSSDPAYVIQTNLDGLVNCLELARAHRADIVFLSTSRVYPYATLNSLAATEGETRFALEDHQATPGASRRGVSELFPLTGRRSLYGATKLAGEILMQEYLEMYGLRGVINRCGVIAGPWQMGKIDQGFVTLWLARHILGGALSYIGFGGRGKQVRDILDVDDLCALLRLQLDRLPEISGEVFNIGGGAENSLSLAELTALCRELTGREIALGVSLVERPGDVRVYVSDCAKAEETLRWRPSKNCRTIVAEVAEWISSHRSLLGPILT